MQPNWRDPNAETPLPIKTGIFYVNRNVLTDVLSPWVSLPIITHMSR
jgi:hypothetical protein